MKLKIKLNFSETQIKWTENRAGDLILRHAIIRR
jgi:hypothetical protein